MAVALTRKETFVNDARKSLNKTPKAIVEELDQHIIGQTEAKRAVAIALRSRWRRMNVTDALRAEITPKNILMIGPTGVGKTEISRRLAQLVNAPFVKVEATKFTEVGYVGRDVDSIIRDLIEVSVKMVREEERKKVKASAKKFAIERVLDSLLPEARDNKDAKKTESAARALFREKLKAGSLDDKEIEVDLTGEVTFGVEIMAPPGMEEMTNQLQDMLQGFRERGSTNKTRRMRVKEALKKLEEEEASKMIDEGKVRERAIFEAEQNGMVFIDEFDKIVRANDHSAGGVSREGVQRDLLPLIEGSSVPTRYGTVKTDHILFIASGAFQLAKPSDLIPELQGRLPIRVELNALTADDFERILTEPNASLQEQYSALMATEGLILKFDKGGIRTIAEIAYQVNEKMENIGARRLYTIMERLLEEVSFEADTLAKNKKRVLVTQAFVKARLANLVKDEDLSRYIL